jgi:hypothetical protein
MIQKTVAGTAVTPAEELAQLQTRVNKLSEARAGAQARVDMLRKQYDTEVAALAELGIGDLAAAPSTIDMLIRKFEEDKASTEATVTELEAKVQQ